MARSGNPRILVVDDHPPTRLLLRGLLNPLGGEVFEAEGGEEAVCRYAELQPDWVIMDIQMAPMDGLTATRAILGRHPAARVVMISQFEDAFLREKAVQTGARACFLKDDLHPLFALIVSENGLSMSTPSFSI